MVSIRGKKSRTDVDRFDHGDLILAMEKLQEVQDELEKINEEANREILEIEEKYNKVKEPVYVRRNEIISSIPDFWLTAFLNHPTLGNLLNEEDQKIFKYLDSLHVEHFKDLRKGYCISFNFKANPYFENTKLTMTIKFLDDGTLKSAGTTIKWKDGKAPADGGDGEKKGNKRPLHRNSFFTWFGFHPELEVDQDVVAELIKEDLWPNPIEHLNNVEDEDDTEDDEDDEEDEEDEEEDEDDEQDCDGKDDA